MFFKEKKSNIFIKSLIILLFVITHYSCSIIYNNTETFEEYCNYLNNLEFDYSFISSMDHESIKKDFILTYEEYLNNNAKNYFEEFNLNINDLTRGEKLFKVSEHNMSLIISIINIGNSEILITSEVSYINSEVLGKNVLDELNRELIKNDEKDTIKVSSFVDCSCTVLNSFYNKVEIHIENNNIPLVIETQRHDILKRMDK